MLEEHEEWLDENGHKLVERVVARRRKNRGQYRVDLFFLSANHMFFLFI